MNGQDMGLFFVDIVMCIDATSDMMPIISEIKNNATSFYQRFMDSMDERDQRVSQLRVKVITFRNYGLDPVAMKESPFFLLPDENEQLRAFMRGIRAVGGSSSSKNALEALALALKSDWTTGGEWRSHTILMFSDAPALALGARADSPSYPAGMPADLAELGAWWEGTDQTFTGTYQAKSGRLVAFVPNAEPWTELTAWNRYWPAFSPAGKGLEDVEIQGAIDMLVGSI